MDFIIALNRPALLKARQRAQGVLRGGLAGIDIAIRERLLQFINLNLGEVGVISDIQILQFRALLQSGYAL